MSRGAHRAPLMDATEIENRRKEREETRALIRELHEHIKGAREVRRDLLQAAEHVARLYETVQDDILNRVQGKLDAATGRVQELVDRELGPFEVRMQGYLEETKRSITDCFAKALAARSPGEFMDVIIEGAAAHIRAELADLTESEADAMVGASARARLESRPRCGQIIVTTPDMAAAAAEVSDIVIDTR